MPDSKPRPVDPAVLPLQKRERGSASCLAQGWHLASQTRIIPQVDVERPDNLETTALGAAYAAGIGAGLWSPEWVMQHRTTARQGDKLRSTFKPQASTAPASPGLHDVRYPARRLWGRDGTGWRLQSCTLAQVRARLARQTSQLEQRDAACLHSPAGHRHLVT